MLFINAERSLSWNATAGETYVMQRSSDLREWTSVSGTTALNGSTFTISPSANPVQISGESNGRISVMFSPDHPALVQLQSFFGETR